MWGELFKKEFISDFFLTNSNKNLVQFKIRNKLHNVFI
jgi:hypothetical protein